MVNVTVVAADDDPGLRLWNPVGAPWCRIVAADGRTHHDATIDQLGDDARLVPLTWRDNPGLFWFPEGEAFSVWWLWHAASGRFVGWKGDLQEPVVRWDDGLLAGVDTADQALDVMVEPDRSWWRKDEAEFADKTGHPLYWSESQARAVRGVGQRLAALAEAGKFPFDGTWCDFRPGPAWRVPDRLPTGWDQPRATPAPRPPPAGSFGEIEHQIGLDARQLSRTGHPLHLSYVSRGYGTFRPTDRVRNLGPGCRWAPCPDTSGRRRC